MKLTFHQIRKTIFLLILVVFVGGIGYRLGESRARIKGVLKFPYLEIEREIPLSKKGRVDFDLFWTVWDKVSARYLDPKAIDPEKMVYGAISGMVASLGDPYTVFLPPSENKEAKDDLRGDFEGVGIQIDYNEEKRIVVVAPLSGTPAEKAGVKAGDVILRIVDTKKNIDKETLGMTLPEAVNLIRGPKGTIVKLTLQRDSQDPFEVELKRDTIIVKSVEVDFKEKDGKKVAVLKLSRFGDRTYDEWNGAVEKIKNESARSGQNFKGIVLDLRNNPGGYLQGAVFIASEFLSKGVIVRQDRGSSGEETYSVDRKGKLLTEPLVVLINSGSASASEIVAGALQETGRAKVVGEKSFGKGTVQEAEDLEGGAGLHITVARWLLPSGKSIDKQGISPDIEVKNDEKNKTADFQLEKAIELLFK